MNDVIETKQPNVFLITAWSFHMSFLWTLLWKFHFFFNWPLEFPCSSIPLEIPCPPHPCHLFGLDFFWNSPLLLVCFHIELGSHLKQVTTVLFSSSRTGSGIFKTVNIGRLTFLIPFSRQEIHEKSTKNEEFQCAVTQAVLVKNSWNKKYIQISLLYLWNYWYSSYLSWKAY